MIAHVSMVSIFVGDQEGVSRFYTGKLGFELHAETPLFLGASAPGTAVARA